MVDGLGRAANSRPFISVNRSSLLPVYSPQPPKMASTGVDRPAPPSYSDQEKAAVLGGKLNDGSHAEPVTSRRLSLSSGSKHDATHRQLKSRHIQLIGIGGTIGTALYVRKELYNP